MHIRPLYTNTYEGTPQIRDAWEDKLLSCYVNPPTKVFLPRYQLKPDTDKMFQDKIVASEKALTKRFIRVGMICLLMIT